MAIFRNRESHGPIESRMQFVSFVLLACVACSFPRPPDVSSDPGNSPDAPDAPADGGGTQRCVNLGHSSLPWPATGSTPYAVTSADLNGDSKPDLVVVNETVNTVSVLLGNGSGEFQAKVDYPTGSDPRAVAVADVNGDAKLDLVVGNFGAFPDTVATVSILLGNGNGTFGAKLDYTASPSAGIEAIAVADVSGDGKPDVLVAASSAISVLLNNGNGTFASRVGYLPGLLSPRSIAIADINGDGKQDIVAAAANDNGNGVLVFLGNGNGTFAAHMDFTLSGTFSLSGVAVADLNGDGKLDVATGDTNTNTVRVLLGNGGGSFTSVIDSPAASVPLAIVVADVNADSKLDLVVGLRPLDASSAPLSVMIGNGKGGFAAGVGYPTDGSGSFAISPEAITAVDINRDGKLDVVAVGHDNLNVLMGNGDGTFAVGHRIPGGIGSRRIITADVNLDGNPDVILTNDGSRSVGVLLGTGDGTFAPRTDYEMGATPSSVAVADVNSDGNADLIVATSKSAVSVLLGSRDGRFAKPVDYLTGSVPVTSITTADVNNDGKRDIVAVNVVGVDGDGNPNAGSVAILLGDGAGAFASKVDHPVGFSSGSVAAVDLNSDGNVDLVVATGDAKATVLMGDGTGGFATKVSYSTRSPASISLADMNRDGKVDLVVQASTDTFIWTGNGDGTFAAQYNSSIPFAALVVSDVVGDSSLDLVAVDRSGVTVSLFAGNGDGTLQDRIIYPVGPGPASVAVSDLNHDGQPDVIVYSLLDNSMSVLLGTCKP